jgi:hypothetical protein
MDSASSQVTSMAALPAHIDRVVDLTFPWF